MPTSPHIESTLSHIISPCSLQPLLLQFSIAAINIVAKTKAFLSIATGAPLHGFSMLPTKAVLSIPTGAPLHGFSMLPHTPMIGALVVRAIVVEVYCPVEQPNPGGAGVLTQTGHPLHPADCPLLQLGGKHLSGHTPSLP